MTHRRLGRYLLVERLRTGGMAEVWRGLAEGPGGFLRKAAIKVILPGYAEDEEFLRMFRDEAAIAARLTHANIAQIHDFDIVDRVPYLAMEYVEGKDLRAVLETTARTHRPIPWELAVGLALEVAKGLYYVHSLREDSRPLSIVHRDISPQNLMVSYTGEVKIVDFGIARAAKRSSVTRAGEVKGKCAYMSPEQALSRMVDGRSDQFSLGIVLWELLTGRRLFGGGTPAETVARLVKTVVPPPHEVRDDLPAELSPLVTRSLTRAPSDRYPNMLVFYDTLSRFLFDRDCFPTPHRLADWLKDLFPEEVKAFHEGEGDDGVPSLDEGPLEVTDLDTGEWRFLKEETDDEATRRLQAGESEEAPVRPVHGMEYPTANDEDSFVPWDEARPEARDAAEAHPALRRTSARTVALYFALAFVGTGLAIAAWAWILGLGPFKQDPMKPPAAVLDVKTDAQSARGKSLEEMDVVVAMPDVVSAERSPPSVDAVDVVDTSPTEGGGLQSEAADVAVGETTDVAVEVAAPPDITDQHDHSREPATVDPSREPATSDPEPEPPPAETDQHDHSGEPATSDPEPEPPPAETDQHDHSREPATVDPKPEPEPATDPATFGVVHVAARPYAQIRVDGRPFGGVAPKDLRLPPGEHVIELEYLDARHTCRVTLAEGGEATCEHSFLTPESPPPAP